MLFIFVCKNSLSGHNRSTRLSDCFHVLWMKASLNGLNPSFLFESFPWLTRKKKYPVRECIKVSTALLGSLKLLPLYLLLFSIDFRAVPSKWSTSKCTNRVTLIPFVGNPHYSKLVHRVWYLKNLLCLEDNRLSFSQVI